MNRKCFVHGKFDQCVIQDLKHEAMTQNDRLSSKGQCGCKIVGKLDPFGTERNSLDQSSLRIRYCPTHARAFEMREFLSWLQEDDLLPMAYANRKGEIRDQLEELLRKVKGTK